MYVSVLRSDPVSPSASPSRQRAVGEVAFSAMALAGRTRPARISESGSMKIRLPRSEGEGLDAVIVNTAGGIACGDRYRVEIEAQSGAVVTVATPAAEKVYRSDGPLAELSVNLSVGASARLEWLPQETILFDRARLSRRLNADMAADASLTVFEACVFGRQASAEQVTEGLFEDYWRVRRGGLLVYADTFRLAGPIAELLRKPGVANGGRAVATFLHVAPDAETRLEAARQSLSPTHECEAGISAWNQMLVARFCAGSIEALRAVACPFLVAFRRQHLPRVWLS